jgi:anhydro-N-acetylmuramic acid kinase
MRTPMTKNKYLGIMTGTSLDAIDLSIAHFENGEIEILARAEAPFTTELQGYLKSLRTEISLKSLSQLNARYTEDIASAVLHFLDKTKIKPQDIKAIGFHGQTVWHQPERENFLGVETRSTYQLGSASLLAIRTGIDAVSDFRTADMALGGQGAPLVPVFDDAFLRENSDVIVLNIGGIANITYLKAGGTKKDVVAFDTGPGNCLIDLLADKHYKQECDRNGDIARTGNPDLKILASLMSENYISRPYPKSTGKELFNSSLLEKYGVLDIDPHDAIATVTHFTALSIAENIKQLTNSAFTLKIAGGGASNKYLIELIGKNLPMAKIETATINGLDIVDSREALLMSYLAYLRINEVAGNMPSVTGAKREAILGVIAKA